MAAGAVSTPAGRGEEGQDDGIGAAATFQMAERLAIADGDAYVLDNGLIRKLDPSGAVVTTVAGGATGTCVDDIGEDATLGRPKHNSIVSDGEYLYWLDTSCMSNPTLRRMELSSAEVATIWDGTSRVVGPATEPKPRPPRSPGPTPPTLPVG